MIRTAADVVILSEAKDPCISVRPETHRYLAALSKAVHRVRFSIEAACRLVLLVLKEIFDENAYARFLDRRQLRPSRHSYREFLRETYCRRERSARCC